MSGEDLALIQDVLAGNTGAFEAILDKYEKPIYNVAYRIVKNRDDAMDVTQTTFVKVYERLDTYNPAHKLFSWLCKIAVNESLTRISSRKREVDINGNDPVETETPEDRAATSERSRQLEEALKELNVDYRIVVVLKYVVDLSYGEIGEILQIPE